MKTVQQKLRWPGVITSIALLALMISSCSKHDDNSVQVATSSMAVIDVSPTAPNLDFYLDGTIVNASPVTYAGGIVYFSCYAGTRHTAFYQNGTNVLIAADTVTLKPTTAYTMLLSNLPSKPDITLLRDSVFAPASGTATLRFVNASPDAGSVDYGLKGKALLGSAVSYRKATPFGAVTPNLITDTVMVYKTGTSTLIQKIPVSLQTEGVYTVYLYGFASQSSANEKLAGGVMENAFY